MTSNILNFPREEWRDPVKALKQILEQMEAGAYGKITVGALVLASDDGVEAFGFGQKADDLCVIGALEAGKHCVMGGGSYDN